jgi:hypothetical protein
LSKLKSAEATPSELIPFQGRLHMTISDLLLAHSFVA